MADERRLAVFEDFQAWQPEAFFLASSVIVVLRLVGVMNAAVWFGAAIFFTIAVAPVVLTTPLLKQYVGEAWLGIVAQMILERYFILQLCCCIVAIVHQMAEWLYLGKPLHRWTMAVLSGLFVIAVADSAWLEPRLNLLHEIKYGYRRGGVLHPATEVRSR